MTAVLPGPAPSVPVGIQKLLEPPDETGYSVTEAPDSMLSAEVDGGAPRTRLDFVSASRFVTVQWSGQKKRWQTVRDFLTQNLALNCPQFRLDLIIATADYAEYFCNVVPGSIKQSSPAGQYYVIQCTLEVEPRDDELDSWPDLNVLCLAPSSLAFSDRLYVWGTYNNHDDDYTAEGTYYVQSDAGTPAAPFPFPFTIDWEDLHSAPSVNVFMGNRAGGTESPVFELSISGQDANTCKTIVCMTFGIWLGMSINVNGIQVAVGVKYPVSTDFYWYAVIVLTNEDGVINAEQVL